MTSSFSSTISSQAALPQATNPTHQVNTFTCVRKPDLYPKSALLILNKFAYPTFRKTNHNISKWTVVATAYAFTKKDTVSNMEYPDWILKKSSHLHYQVTQGQGGRKS